LKAIQGKTTIKSDPLYLGTKPIKLPKPGKMGKSRIVAVNMFLPPGVSQFFIERIDAKNIRFLILTEEVNRLADKAEKMMEADGQVVK